MSNPTPEQLDLTQPVDRVVKQIVDLAAAEREAKGWWQAVLRLVPKEHHAPADVIRYLEERLNAWGGLLAAAGFEQGDGVRAAQRITDEVRAYARLRGGLALRLGAPRNAADAVLLERLNDLASLAHGVESLRELNAGLKAQLEEARPKAAMWDALKRVLRVASDTDVIPLSDANATALGSIAGQLGLPLNVLASRIACEVAARLADARRFRTEVARRSDAAPELLPEALLEHVSSLARNRQHFCDSIAQAFEFGDGCTPAAILSAAITKQRQADGWAQVARLLCGDACDLSDVSGVVAAAQKQRDEVDALRACVHPAAWARLEKALGAPKTITQIVEQVEHLVESRDAEKARHADELTKAQALVDLWDMEYQDLRDKVADFHTQISRALGVEPLSLTADEMLRRISEGAAAWRTRAQIVEALRIPDPAAALVAPDALVEYVQTLGANKDLVTRLRAMVFPGLMQLDNVRLSAIETRVEKALAAEGLLRELHAALKQNAPGFAANAEMHGLPPTDALLLGLRDRSAKIVYCARDQRGVAQFFVDLELGERLQWTERKRDSVDLGALEALGEQLLRWVREQTKAEAQG